MCLKCQNNSLFLQDNSKKFALDGSSFWYTPDKTVQVKHIFLDLEFDIDKSSFSGSSNITFSPIASPVSELEIDAVKLTIEKIEIEGQLLDFDYDSKKIRVVLDRKYNENEIFTINIFYSKENSEKGIYFIKPSPQYPNKATQVWTQGETEDSRHWFPCLDYTGQLATSETKIKVKSPYKVISNGILVDTIEKDNSTIYHWKQNQPHPSYLIALAIGDFAEIKDENNVSGVPIAYYTEKGKEHLIPNSAGKTPQMMKFLQDKFDVPYAWDKYYQVWVDDFRFGGMENTTCTFIFDDGLVDDKAKLEFLYAETVGVHELAHHWFGDFIVAKHWSHAWIKEGAVSYFECVWWEKEYGFEEGAYYRLSDLRAYLNEDSTHYRRPVVTNFYRNSGELYDRHLYDKGSAMYHMIHSQLGDDLFWKTISTFLKTNAHSTVETIDLIRAIEKATGRNLLWLFDQYIFRGGFPDFKVGFAWDGSSKLAKISISQTQAKDDEDFENLFKLKIPVALGYVNNGTVEYKEFNLDLNQKDHNFYIPLDSKPSFISFDKGNHFIKKVVLDYPIAELKSQLKYDTDPISKIYAAEAISKKGGIEGLSILSEALKTEKFWGVKVEIINFLNEIKLDQVKDVLLENLNDADPRVKRAVINSLSNFKSKDIFDSILPIAQDFDQSYFVQATALKTLGEISGSKLADGINILELLDLFQNILENGDGWNQVVRNGAILGLTNLPLETRALDLLIKYTKNGTHDQLRRGAIRGLGVISKGLEANQLNQVVNILDEISKENNYFCEISISMACASIKSPRVLGILENIKNQSTDDRSSRLAEETITTVRKNLGLDKSIQGLNEEFDKLKKSNQELKSRLELLEAKNGKNEPIKADK